MAQVLRERLAGLLVQIDDDDVAAFLHDHLRRGRAQARRSAGDHRHFSGNLHEHYLRCSKKFFISSTHSAASTPSTISTR